MNQFTKKTIRRQTPMVASDGDGDGREVEIEETKSSSTQLSISSLRLLAEALIWSEAISAGDSGEGRKEGHLLDYKRKKNKQNATDRQVTGHRKNWDLIKQQQNNNKNVSPRNGRRLWGLPTTPEFFFCSSLNKKFSVAIDKSWGLWLAIIAPREAPRGLQRRVRLTTSLYYRYIDLHTSTHASCAL